MQEALLLSDLCRQVYVIQNRDTLTGEQKLQEIIKERENIEVITGSVVASIPDGPAFRGIVIRRVSDGAEQMLAVDAMFVAIGLVPENGAFQNLVALDQWGYVDAGEDCTTRTPGVFVAGDCRRKGVRQVTTATGVGFLWRSS